MSRTSVRARISAVPTGRISVKFGIVYFYENLSKQIQIWVKSKTSRILHEHVRTIHVADRDIVFVNNTQGKHSCASMTKNVTRTRHNVTLQVHGATSNCIFVFLFSLSLFLGIQQKG